MNIDWSKYWQKVVFFKVFHLNLWHHNGPMHAIFILVSANFRSALSNVIVDYTQSEVRLLIMDDLSCY